MTSIGDGSRDSVTRILAPVMKYLGLWSRREAISLELLASIRGGQSESRGEKLAYRSGLTFLFVGLFLSCKAERGKRPSSSEAKFLGGGMMLSWIIASLRSCNAL